MSLSIGYLRSSFVIADAVVPECDNCDTENSETAVGAEAQPPLAAGALELPGGRVVAEVGVLLPDLGKRDRLVGRGRAGGPRGWL